MKRYTITVIFWTTHNLCTIIMLGSCERGRVRVCVIVSSCGVSSGNLIVDIFRAPIQITVGLLYGVIFGLLLWIFPTKHFVS